MSHETVLAESIQGQNYHVGQQFKTYTDYFEPNTSEYIEFVWHMSLRKWILMIYLNAVALGDKHVFPDLGLTFTPVVGRDWYEIVCCPMIR